MKIYALIFLVDYGGRETYNNTNCGSRRERQRPFFAVVTPVRDALGRKGRQRTDNRRRMPEDRS